MRSVIAALVATAVVAVGVAGAETQRPIALQHVTLIGDSVADAIAVNPSGDPHPRGRNRSRRRGGALPPGRRRRMSLYGRSSAEPRRSCEVARAGSSARTSLCGRVQRLRGSVRGEHRNRACGIQGRRRAARLVAHASCGAPSVSGHERRHRRGRGAASRADGRRLERLFARPPGLVPDGRCSSSSRWVRTRWPRSSRALVAGGIALPPLRVLTTACPRANTATVIRPNCERPPGCRPSAGHCSNARQPGSTSRRTGSSRALRAHAGPLHVQRSR